MKGAAEYIQGERAKALRSEEGKTAKELVAKETTAKERLLSQKA